MNRIRWLILLVPLVLQAENIPPLRVAITSFAAPYIMQGNNQQFYGFDISMMSNVCKLLQRRCIYIPMTLKQIYPAIINNKADLAVSTIVISADKAKYVAISMPYMLSEGQYIGSINPKSSAFSESLLTNKRIGVVAGSTYETYIKKLENTQNIHVITFDSHDQIIDGLRNHGIDFGLLDTHIVQYWQNNSSGT
ncbi:MAG: hypothetical protein B7X00_01660, partial [Legionella sp. 21-45-4]